MAAATITSLEMAVLFQADLPLLPLRSCLGPFAPPLPVWVCWHPLQRN